MDEQTTIAALSGYRKRLHQLLNHIGDSQPYTTLLSSCRTIVSSIDDLLNLLEVYKHEHGSDYIKGFNSFLQSAGAIIPESEFCTILLELQREAADAIMFLEGVVTTVEASYRFIDQDTVDQNKILASHKGVLDKLSSMKEGTHENIRKNEKKIQQLHEEISTIKTALQDIEGQSVRSRNFLKRSGFTSSHDIGDCTSEKALTRASEASCLLSGLDAIPLKVLEEGPEYIAYEHKRGKTHTIIRLRDSVTKGFSLTVEPANTKVQEYLREHLYKCKSRIQIAAILQEALSLP